MRIFVSNKQSGFAILPLIVIVGAFLISGSIIYDSRGKKSESKNVAEIQPETTPAPTPSPAPPTQPQIKLKPQQKQQKLSVPTPIEAPSGPPITLYAKTAINVYEKPSESSKILAQYQQYTYWNFPYTPTGSWYLVFTETKQQGYVRSSDMTTDAPPTPTPAPAHCSLKLTYRVGRVDDFFTQKGFTSAKLNELLEYSEKQWEDALGKDIFEQGNNGPNAINFIVDPLGAGSANAEGHYGRLYSDRVYPNGTVEGFTIKIYSELFTYAAQPRLLYYGEPTTQDKLNEAVVARVITHELGHAIGLGHLDLEKVEYKESIMIGGKSGGYATSYLPKLTSDDLNLLKDFCGTN